MDAGCGTGQLTRQLAKQVPRGKVYAVDIDSNMIKQAKKYLKSFDNVDIIQSSLTDVKLPRKVDVVFLMPLFIGYWIIESISKFLGNAKTNGG
jgi:trans-aconitate 2-methyltransferase